MANPLSGDPLTFDCPAPYQIRVSGRVPASWSDRFEGMAITVKTTDDGQSVSTLEGELTDQASLMGVLNTLYGLHLPVLSVQCRSYFDGAPNERSAESTISKEKEAIHLGIHS